MHVTFGNLGNGVGHIKPKTSILDKNVEFPHFLTKTGLSLGPVSSSESVYSSYSEDSSSVSPSDFSSSTSKAS